MYIERREGRATVFVGEARQLKKKRRFKTERDARDYEAFCKLMGREPPTIDDRQESTGAPTFAQVTEQAKKAGGPKGKWKSQRDPTLMQRLDYCVSVIGTYEIQRVTRAVLKKITESLDNRPASPGKSGVRGHDATRACLSNATKNRYLSAASAVMTYAVNEEIIEHAPAVPWLNEKDERRHRDILKLGQDEVILRLMEDAGARPEALCVDMLIQTGLRSGELQKLQPDQLQVEQVEAEDGTPVLVGVVYLRRGQTKNNTARRVFFSADLAKQIKAMIVTGTLPKADKLLDAFKLACKRAGYTGNLVIHSLRHTRNTRLRKAGVSAKLRKEMIGHVSDEANEIYDHVDDADQLEAVKLVENYAGRGTKKGPEAAVQVIDFAKRGAG